jgi:hypothetical protein
MVQDLASSSRATIVPFAASARARSRAVVRKPSCEKFTSDVEIFRKEGKDPYVFADYQSLITAV